MVKKYTDQIILILRLAMGWLFLYAGVIKILDSSWSASGYLNNAQTFAQLYKWFASDLNIGWVNFVNQWGLTLVGLALILGIKVRWASTAGILFIILYYFPVLNFPYVGEHSLIIDEHVIYILVLWALIIFRSGEQWTVGPYLQDIKWNKLWVMLELKLSRSRSVSKVKSPKKGSIKDEINGIFESSKGVLAWMPFYILAIYPAFVASFALIGLDGNIGFVILGVFIFLLILVVMAMALRWLYEQISSGRIITVLILLLIAYMFMALSFTYEIELICSNVLNGDEVYSIGGWPVASITIDSPDIEHCRVKRNNVFVNYIFWLSLIVGGYRIMKLRKGREDVV